MTLTADKDIRIRFISGACLLFYLLFAFQTLKLQAEAAPSLVNTNADGIALISEGNTAKGREEAVENALQKAIEQVVSTIISGETIAENREILSVNVYYNVRRYVQNYRIVLAKIIGNLYQVSVEVSVSADNLREDLSGLGLLNEERFDIAEEVAVKVIISGLGSYDNFADLKDIIQHRISGVNNVLEKRFGAGGAILEVRLYGSARKLADSLTMIDYEYFAIDITEVTDDTVRVEVRPQ